MAKRALDSSEFAGHVDWKNAEEMAFDIGIARAVGGTTINKKRAVRLDKLLTENAAKIAETKLQRGLYVPFFPDVDLTLQLDVACEAFDAVKLGDQDIIAVDFEVLRGVAPRDALELLVEYCATLEMDAKKTPWFYSNPDFIARFSSLYEMDEEGALRKTNAGNPVPLLQKLTGYPLWLSEWGRARLGPPPPPKPFARLDAWQFRGTTYIPNVGLCDESFVYDEGEEP